MTPAEVEALLGLAGLGGGAISAAGLVRLRAAERWRLQLTAHELRFPRGLDERAVVTLLAGLAGLVPERWRRWYATQAVVLEAHADGDGIRHYLIIPRSYVDLVLAQLRSALPAVRATPVDLPVIPDLRLAAQLDLSTVDRPLGETRSAASAAMLAGLANVRRGESAVVQWIIQPTAPVALPQEISKTKKTSEVGLADLMREQPQTAEQRNAFLAKHAWPVFVAAGRLGIAAEPQRARSLLVGVLAGLHHLNVPGVHLRQARRSNHAVAHALQQRRPPLFTGHPTLNAQEVSGVIAWPLGILTAPGLELGGTRQLAPHRAIPTGPRVIAEATYPGAERPLGLSVSDSLKHLHVVGPTGTGKSTLLLNMITGDIQAGHGVVVVDPKRDLVEAVLDRIPRQRVRDVIVLDPTDDARPVGLNPLAGSGPAELVVEQTVGILHGLFKAFWGPRTDDVLRATLSTLLTQPGMTLVEVPLLLTDEGFRRRLVGRLNDPVALGPFWGWYEGLSDAERAQVIGPVLNKLRAFLLRPRVRNVIGQADGGLDLAAAIASRKIVLVSLSKGLLGEEAAQLVGSLVVAQLWQAVQARAGVPESQRPPVFAYIDEMQDYLHLPTSLADLLAQARGLGLSLTLAHQHLGQLPAELRQAVLANARSRVIFQTSADDARTLAKELAPHLGAEDLQGLGAYEVVARLAAGSQVVPPVSGRTYPPPRATGQAEAVRAASRATWGRDRPDIEAAMTARHGHGPGRQNAAKAIQARRQVGS